MSCAHLKLDSFSKEIFPSFSSLFQVMFVCWYQWMVDVLVITGTLFWWSMLKQCWCCLSESACWLLLLLRTDCESWQHSNTPFHTPLITVSRLTLCCTGPGHFTFLQHSVKTTFSAFVAWHNLDASFSLWNNAETGKFYFENLYWQCQEFLAMP